MKELKVNCSGEGSASVTKQRLIAMAIASNIAIQEGRVKNIKEVRKAFEDITKKNS